MEFTKRQITRLSPTRWLLRVLDILVPLVLISLEIFLNVIAFGTVINSLIVLVLITSPLWVLLCIFWWPVVLILFAILKFTSISTYIHSLLVHSLHHMLYRYKGQARKSIWVVLHSLLALNTPNYITAQNCGYALVSASGKSIQESELKKPMTERERDNIFQFQLYHKLVQCRPSLKGLKVLDLACGRGGGLAFLAEHFGIAKAVGVDFCPRSITFANDTFKDFSACPLTFIQGDIEYLPQCMPDQKFDLILSVESWHALPFPRSTLKQAKEMLSDSDSPRLIIADGFLNSMLAELENDFKLYFEIEQQIDISYNVRSARHLGAERMDKILEHANQNRDLFKWTSRYCQSMLPGEFMSSPIQGSQPFLFYKQLDEQERRYLIYVLKPLKKE